MHRFFIVSAVAAPLLLASACGEDGTGPGVETDPPAALAISAPEDIVQGQPFSLAVDALDAAGQPDRGWSGTVTLSASAGSISPATIEVSNGRASVEATLSGAAGAVILSASSGSVRADLAVTALSGEQPVRLEIVPGSLLLTAAGEAHPLRVRAYDAEGQPTVPGDVTWTSSDPGSVSVSAGGTATALAELGSAQITATAGSVTSPPAPALIASPTPGALLVADSLVVEPPAPVDAGAAYEPGWQYTVVLRGLTPEVGEILIGTGEIPIAGRTVAVTGAGEDEVRVTLELIPLNELFAQLSLDLLIPLVEMPAEQANRLALARASRSLRASETEFSLAGFTCKASGEVPDLALPDPSLEINPTLALALGYENGLDTYAVVGGITAAFGYEPEFKAAFEGEVGCERVLRTLTVPLGGFLSFFFGIQVPVGIGLDLDGKLKIAEVGFDISANASATVELGMRCPTNGGGCTGLTTFETQRDGSFEFVSPDPEDQFRVELGAHGFLFAKPALGSAFSSSTQFEFIDAHAGLKQEVTLATAHGQAADPEYASAYHLAAIGEIGPGSDLNDAIDKLGDLLGVDLSVDLTLVEVEDTLAESPRGTFTITPGRVAPGDSTELGEMTTFKVELDPVRYLGLPSVDRVRFYWRKPDEEGGFALAGGRPACTSVASAPDQRVFSCETDFLEEHRGVQTFHAFAESRLFGVPLPVPVEIANDGRASVAVGEQCTPAGNGYRGTLRDTTTIAHDPHPEDVHERTVDPMEFGHLHLTASAVSSRSTGMATYRARAIFDDSLMVVPDDRARAGDLVNIRMRLRGHADRSGGAYHASVYFQGSAELYTQGNTGYPETMEVDRSFAMTFRAGEWGWIEGLVNVDVLAQRDGRIRAGSASLRLEFLGVETMDGEPIAAQVCSASGSSY